VQPADQTPFTLYGALAGTVTKPVARLLERSAERLTGLDYLARKYRTLPVADDVAGFLQQALDCLRVRFTLNSEALDHFPEHGPVIVVANHPFGAIDGMILTLLVYRLRRDVRILGNYFLARIPGISDLLFAVDPFAGKGSATRNLRPLRDCLKWLQQGGVVITFPSGEVAHYLLRQQRIIDPPWSNTIGKLVQASRATVFPVYFHGRNSLWFQCAGLLHPLLRTCLLPHELIRKQGETIRLQAGEPLEWSKLKRLDSAEKITRYLRLRTFLLRNHVQVSKPSRSMKHDSVNLKDSPAKKIIAAIPVHQLKAEIESLPPSQCLIESGEYEVYLARAADIPMVMQEIGRLRELTFRQAGEGTGRSMDLDLYDSYYYHLFLWNREQQQLVGAYRLGLVHEILQHYGRKGLYTCSLFKFKRGILPLLDRAIEVGRSFVRFEYQKSFFALNLLWRGIGVFVAEHPACPVLFGPVSISREYGLVSRHLLVDCLSLHNFEPALSPYVKARHPWRSGGQLAWHRQDLDAIDDLNLVSDLVSAMEKDNKGVPILVRQYLKLGGRFVGFNIDPEFADVVDGLIFVDLRNTQRSMLNKYMGADHAAAFLAGHVVAWKNTDEPINVNAFR